MNCYTLLHNTYTIMNCVIGLWLLFIVLIDQTVECCYSLYNFQAYYLRVYHELNTLLIPALEGWRTGARILIMIAELLQYANFTDGPSQSIPTSQYFIGVN